MDQSMQVPPENKMSLHGPDKKGKAAMVASIVLAILLAASVGLLAWVYMQAEADKKKLSDEKAQLQVQIDLLMASASPEASAAPAACNDTPSDSMKANIKDALDSKNTAVFETYVTDPVIFVLAGTEKGGQDSAAEAAQGMSYTHSATGPWDFDLSAETIANYEAGFYRDYFDANTYAGKADSGMVASFDFDCDGKIKQIFISASEDMLLE